MINFHIASFISRIRCKVTQFSANHKEKQKKHFILVVCAHEERRHSCHFSLIYIKNITKSQIFNKKTDKMFVVSDF